MRDLECGQCRRDLEWEEEKPGYHVAACACGRKYTELKLVKDKARLRLPLRPEEVHRETHSWEARAQIDRDYHGDVLA